MRARETLLILSYGGFLVAQAAARRMLPKGRGTILLTGASASVKGYPQSAVFAMGKFALRGLAQSLARELSPKGIHVVHFVIDGSVRNSARGRTETADVAPDSYLDPDPRSRKPIWTSCTSTEAPGRGKSSSGPGWNIFSGCVRNGPYRNGAPDTIRTCGLYLRRVALYSAELRVPALLTQCLRGFLTTVKQSASIF